MVVIDTSIIIDHLRKSVDDSTLLRLFEKYPNETFCISLVSIQELYEGQSTRDEVKENQLTITLSSFEILPYLMETAKLAGKIARDTKFPIEFADAAIAATTISNQAKLCTLNEKHFEDIPNLDLLHT